MRVGDRVEMKKFVCPKSKFRTGVVMEVGKDSDQFGGGRLYMVRIKRDNYRGHEFTWWNDDDWKVCGRRGRG